MLKIGLIYNLAQEISRKCNVVADSVANRARVYYFSGTWIDYVPDWLFALV